MLLGVESIELAVQNSIKGLSAALENCVSIENTDDPALLEASEDYINQVDILLDAASQAGFSGLQKIGEFINNNWMSFVCFDTQEKHLKKNYFEQWPTLVLEYLQNPEVAAPRLVSFLQEPAWPVPLETADDLLSVLLKTDEDEVAETEAAAPIELAAPEILELVSQQLMASSEELSATLEACISLEPNDPVLLENSENYTTQVQDIWDTAEMAGLSGLQKVCTFVNDNWMTFILQDKSQKVVTKVVFEQWPTLVLEYLQNPQVAAPRLVNLLQESTWPMPLEKAEDLLNVLLKKEESKIPAEPAEPPVATEESISAKTPSIAGNVGDVISLGNTEMVEMLCSELESSKETLATALNQLSTLANGETALTEASESYIDQVQRLAGVAEMLGLEGLQTICSVVISNVTALSAANLDARLKAKQVLDAWLDFVLAYLRSPDKDTVIPLVNHFRSSEWSDPLLDDQAHNLLNKLVAGSTLAEEEEEQTPSRKTIAQPEDVLINIPDDIDPELWEAYLQDAQENSANFIDLINEIIKNPERAKIAEAQRIAHTLKGSSNTLGITAIANIAHPLEDTLEYLAENQIVPPKALTDMMVEAADCLAIMVDGLVDGETDVPEALPVLQLVLDWANRIDTGNLDAPPPPSPPSTGAVDGKSEASSETKPVQKTAVKPAVPAASSGATGQVLKVPTTSIDELIRLVGELSISVGQIQDKLKHLMNNARTLSDQNLIMRHRTLELEKLVDVRGVTGVESATTTHKTDLDSLEFQEYNELHSVSHSFIESVDDNRELSLLIQEDIHGLEEMFIHQERLNKEFETNIMKTRMVPVKTIVSKLERIVRQTARSTGKNAQLEVYGQEILIDSDVLNNLADPMLHILRNSIDHGLETPEKRQNLEKPETGTIKVSFYTEGNNIVVKCEDDGQGLNYESIRSTAIERGVITPNQELTEKELARLILLSGFSTKSGVTQVSGRGIGMDVVHTNIKKMKGTLDLTSETGKGTMFLIKLPMSLVTVHVLLVNVAGYRFGIPTNTLERALAAGMGKISKIGDDISLKLNKNMYAIKSLADLLNLPGEREPIEEEEDKAAPILLVHEETGVTAVVVDELIDTHDLVMKTMGQYVRNIHGVAGASILGDGSVVILLDIPDLLRSPMQSVISSHQGLSSGGDDMGISYGVPCVMIVDDSLSVRKSLSLLVEEEGYDTLLAKDGQEAVEILNDKRPDVMLVDMEMPRMNGLELTAYVRHSQSLQNMPIFMITSRTTKKHREMAKEAGVTNYLTKPYQDSELLELIDNALMKK
jgi:chemosensory pili system protein ChpA (sensor histidine kinase/response regulator)